MQLLELASDIKSYLDVAQWRNREFDAKENEYLQETFIWRFFIQINPALAFIHNKLGLPDSNGYVLQ